MPPAFLNHRVPTACGTPTPTAASSLAVPAAIAAQNRRRSSRPATGVDLVRTSAPAQNDRVPFSNVHRNSSQGVATTTRIRQFTTSIHDTSGIRGPISYGPDKSTLKKRMLCRSHITAPALCILSAVRYRRPEQGGKRVNMSRMTSCRTCGGMIAETASACPRCGAIVLQPRSSVVAVGLIIMLVIAILYVLSQRYW